MSAGDPVLSIVILTEDGGDDGRPTVEALARKMLDLVVPGFFSHKVRFLPSEPHEEQAMSGNVWKTDGRNPVERERKVRLLRYLVRRLSQEDTFVLFHIDGDVPWEKQKKSENCAKFDELVRVALPQVADRGRANAPKGKARGAISAEPPPALHLDRLLLVCPFRSIEAWLYQNIPVAIELCRVHDRGAHVEKLKGWENAREELDELPAPETEVCLKKKHNLDLAKRGFPAAEVYAVQKSFASSVDRLKGCIALADALERTRA